MVEKGRQELEVKNLELENALATIKRIQAEKDTLIGELQTALGEVKTLGGLVPICSYCKKNRDDDGYWNRIENYIETKTDAQFSHGICDDCMAEKYPEVKDEIKKEMTDV